MKEQVKAVLEMLTKEQVQQIRDHDKGYVLFNVSVFNAGAFVDVEFYDDIEGDSDEFLDNYGPYSFYLESCDAIHCLDKLHL